MTSRPRITCEAEGANRRRLQKGGGHYPLSVSGNISTEVFITNQQSLGTDRPEHWIIDHSMYASGFSCYPVASLSVISVVLSEY